MNLKNAVVHTPVAKKGASAIKPFVLPAGMPEGVQVVVEGLDEKAYQQIGMAGWDDIVSQTMGLTGVARHHLIQAGLQTNVLKEVLESYHGVPEEALLQAIGLSTKTLSRRADARLGSRHSDAAMALIEVTDTAQRVLGNRELAEEWLTKPALALDGMRPLDLISSTPGIESVKDLLTRMEYGVYA